MIEFGARLSLSPRTTRANPPFPRGFPRDRRRRFPVTRKRSYSRSTVCRDRLSRSHPRPPERPNRTGHKRRLSSVVSSIPPICAAVLRRIVFRSALGSEVSHRVVVRGSLFLTSTINRAMRPSRTNRDALSSGLNALPSTRAALPSAYFTSIPAVSANL